MAGVIALDANLLIAHFDPADVSACGSPPRDDGEPLRLAGLRVDTGLKLPDCCVLDIALGNRATLATFDDRLAQAAGRCGVRIIPTG